MAVLPRQTSGPESRFRYHEGGQITTGEAAAARLPSLLHARFNETEITTHIGILHEPGRPEAWIIAMDSTPTKGRVLDYGMRWGIEPMFSDFNHAASALLKPICSMRTASNDSFGSRSRSLLGLLHRHGYGRRANKTVKKQREV